MTLYDLAYENLFEEIKQKVESGADVNEYDAEYPTLFGAIYWRLI